MSTHANMVQMTVTSVAADPYTITLNAASSGFQTFGSAYAGNATVDILITQGTVWEVARDCTYTHSGTTVTRGTLEASSTGARITTFDNTAIVSVVATADSGRRWDSGALQTVASSADAAVTGVVGQLHALDISAFSANRTFTLPTTFAVDDRIGVVITTGDDAFELLVTAGTGDTLNGVAGGTEWSRLFSTGETLVFRAVAADTWVVDVDGRQAQTARMGLTVDITTSTAGAWKETLFTETLFASGATVTHDTVSKIRVRRSGRYFISGGMLSRTVALADQQAFGWSATSNGSASTGTPLCAFSSSRTSGSAVQGNSGAIGAPANAGDLIQHNFYWGVTANAGLRGLNYASYLSVAEIL